MAERLYNVEEAVDVVFDDSGVEYSDSDDDINVNDAATIA